MNPLRTRLLGAGLTAALTAGTLLAAPPAAHAAPVFTDLKVVPYHWSNFNDTTCDDDGSTPGGSSPQDLSETGAPVTTSVTHTTKVVATGAPADKITSTATLQATASATSATGQPRSMRVDFAGTVSVDAANAASACSITAYAGVDVDFKFTITQPMWATLNVAKKGSVYAEAYIYDDLADHRPYEDLYGRHLDGSGSTTVLLPTGTYAGYVEGEVQRYSNKDFTGTGSGSASITFAPVGSASQAPTGKAGKYVALPNARSCAAHTATATLTTKKKLAKHIDKVTFTVNGKKAATLKGKKVKKGKAVVLPLADNTAADITATVVLDNGKKKTVDAGYLACTS